MKRALLLGGMAFSGVLAALAFPALDAWPLILVGLVPLLLCVERQSPAASALLGAAWGAGFFGCLLSWLLRFFHHYGSLPVLLSLATLAVLVGYLSVYPALFAYLASRWLARFPSSALLLLPALWVGLEWVRGHFLSGFPWGSAGYALVDCLPLAQVASLTGVYGLSFLVLLANAAIARVISRAARGARPLGAMDAVCAAGFLLLFAWGSWALRAIPSGEGSLRAALVQGSVPQDQKWDAQAASLILERHERMTVQAAEAGAALVLWPESSSPYALSTPSSAAPGGLRVNLAYRARLETLARENQVSILLGAVDYRPSPEGARPINAAALVRPDGTWGETYAKMHLVPFGEYVPLSRLLGFVNRIAQGAIGDFLPGRSPVVVAVPGAKVGTLICYEMIFPELVRRFVNGGATVLANLTNDAWFGTSAGPHQHFQMARLRAIENRRYVLRAANTGISALVDPAGRVVRQTRLEEVTVLQAALDERHDRSFYTRHGEGLVILCAILAAAALAADFKLRPRRAKERPTGE
jgi:apolipoprotein N-acyltransferase